MSLLGVRGLEIPRVKLLGRLFSSVSNTEWKRPKGHPTGVFLKNSLLASTEAGGMVELVLPRERVLTWYSCGPTVYDSAHIGHARNYVGFDIVRRVLQNYHGISIVQAMNITDIDDKIIQRAKERGVPWKELSRHFEKEFFEDMSALGVKPPEVLIRVTDNIPEIQDFVQKLMDKKFAYKTHDGVYFDAQEFGRMGKLAPSRYTDEVQASAALIETDDIHHKKHSGDFALWKVSADDDTSWSTPWGQVGRPGWHVECSAMAQKVFGTTLDVHSGGIDLMFPHHENEIAQCEACFGVDQWANYFVHSGHLHIDGLKMSKSLKNFITIRQFLENHSATHMRLFCLLHHYSSNIDYSEAAMVEVLKIEKRFAEFFRMRSGSGQGTSSTDWETRSMERIGRPGAAEMEMAACIAEGRNKVNASLCELDTKSALSALLHIVNRCHSIAKGIPDSSRQAHLYDLTGEYVENVLSILGVDMDKHAPAKSSGILSSGSAAGRFVDEVVSLRANVRKISKEALANDVSSKQMAGKLLSACDDVRDRLLNEHSIRINDTNDESSARWVIMSEEEVSMMKQAKELKSNSNISGRKKKSKKKGGSQ